MKSYDTIRLPALLGEREGPCLSLYQTTHRTHPDNQQDPIRFRNLVDELEQSLRREYPSRDVQALLAPLRELAGDFAFWQQALDGLAVLRSTDLYKVLRLQRPVGDVALVAESFHIKPLLRIVQSADRYQVLALTRDSFRVYEGNRDALDELALPEGMREEVERALPRSDRVVRTEGDRQGEADWTDKERERYFRAVDQAVLEHCSRPSGMPLLLIALPEHQGAFRAVSRNPWLLPEGLRTAPDAIDPLTLRATVWKQIEPRYLERLAWLVDSFRAALGTGLASDDPARVGRAAVGGAVATLLVEAGRKMGGRLDAETGEITPADIGKPDVGDVLDDIAEHVLQRGGEVIVVPAERMPSGTGLAATFRY